MQEFSDDLSPSERAKVNFMPRHGWTYGNDEIALCTRLQKAWEDFNTPARAQQSRRKSAADREAAAQLRRFLAPPI